MSKIIKEINGKEYTFKFGLRFVAELDKLVVTKQEGIPFSVGSAIKLGQLANAKDILALADVLKIANETESPRLSVNDLNEWLEDGLTVDEIDSLIDEVVEALSKSNATASKMKALAAAEQK